MLLEMYRDDQGVFSKLITCFYVVCRWLCNFCDKRRVPELCRRIQGEIRTIYDAVGEAKKMEESGESRSEELLI